ncbi:diphthine--ammonia ligase [Chloroflexota bacterium]
MEWKDSCLAGYLATTSGLKIRYLANMISEDGQRSRSHGISANIIRVQSQAMGIPLVQQRTVDGAYEAEFKSMLRTFKEKGVEGGVFGDIDFEEHRRWVERVCQEVDITPHLPLWGQSQDRVLRNFIKLGFESIVVVTMADLLGEEWLGHKVDLDFINHLEKLSETKDITPCGEAGEYHTLVVDGPLFNQRMEILKADRVLREGRWFLEILDTELRNK